MSNKIEIFSADDEANLLATFNNPLLLEEIISCIALNHRLELILLVNKISK